MNTPQEVMEKPAGDIGDQIARTNNPFGRGLAKLILRLSGWRVAGALPNSPKMVITAAPHTSNMDGFIFLVVVIAMGLRVRFIAKNTLFKGLLGKFLIRMGGFPIDRAAAKDVVQQVADEFASLDQMILVLAPEGTRSAAEKWKTGFVRMAEAAHVPICLCFLDYKEKVIGLGPSMEMSGDHEADLATIQDFYRPVNPKVPENFVCK